MKNLTGLIIAVFALGILTVFGQDDIQTPNGRPLPTTPEQASKRDFESRLSAMNRLMNQRPEAPRARSRRLTKEERKRFEEATEPPEDIKLKYEEFLDGSNTGIFRLLPNFNCQTDNIIKIDGECAGFVPDAWAYSFRFEDYSGKDFHDIKYEGDRLVTDSLLNQGILVNLGEIHAGSVGLDHPGAAYLKDFVPAEDRDGAAVQFREISEGTQKGDFFYSNSVRMEVGDTYLLRGIAYRFGDKWASRFRGRNEEKLLKEEHKFALIRFDKRIDSIYVFTVVRRDEDGGITIVWKRLSKEKSPKIVFEEDERLRDF
ncbi:MAG: hypothetical protein R2681_02180 [Pyrinomonadaceae bacterium]